MSVLTKMHAAGQVVSARRLLAAAVNIPEPELSISTEGLAPLLETEELRPVFEAIAKGGG